MSSRLEAIVDQPRIRPDGRVLEIGCGHGAAATLVCGRLDGGRLTAIDRSAKMIEAAARRNAAYEAAGHVVVGARRPHHRRARHRPLRLEPALKLSICP